MTSSPIVVAVLGGPEDLHGAARVDDGGPGGEVDSTKGDGRDGPGGTHQDPRRHRGGVHAAGTVPPGHEEVHPGRQQGQGEGTSHTPPALWLCTSTTSRTVFSVFN